jgi:tetratricopeptide (TPR) repeat protein
MMLQKLKVAALQHEQREDWRGAIDLYRQAIREAEAASEGGDPSLYNRVGDLAHKAGDDAAACEAWEQAVNRYSELGFFNSAIALCGKVLRVAPDRLQTYLELARLQARKRVLFDVRQNLKLYLDRMNAAGRSDAARGAITQFGEEFPGWRDLDALLDEMLGRERPTEQASEAVAGKATGPGGLVFLDTGPLQLERASEPAVPLDQSTGLDRSVVADLTIETRPEVTISGLESTIADDGVRDVASHVEGLVGVEQAARDMAPVQRLEGIDGGPETGDTGPVTQLDGLERTAVSGAQEADAAGAEPPEGGANLVFIETEAPPPPEPPPTAALDDPLGQRVMAQALLEHGDRAGGIAALERSLGIYQDRSEWLHAFQVVSELIQAEPRAIGRYQARVEIAARMRDQGRLCDAYVELGDALVREGSGEKAVAVYRRVLEIDDNNARARAALQAMAPATPGRDVEAGFIDLGAELIDDHPTSTRMRTEMPEVAPDENDTFRDALAEFKRALDQNLPIEDHQAHYDLGIAFKEMGLLDEAIGEFQKALRAPEVRLRTSEALGEVFFDQGRPAVAEAVLRGVEAHAGGDAEKIGVLYWLARALDAQGKHTEAIAYYQRIIAVDVGFRDASERLTTPPSHDGAAEG